MCLHLPTWSIKDTSHPPYCWIFCTRAGKSPAPHQYLHNSTSIPSLKAYTSRLSRRERGGWKKLWEEKLNDNHVAFINGNDGTLASVLKMNCSSCDVVINVSFSCPLVHCVDNVNCIPRLKVLRLAHYESIELHLLSIFKCKIEKRTTVSFRYHIQ